jgi:hypothetical protein
VKAVFVGVDGEMTGSSFRRHRLVQIGLATSLSSVFVHDIGWESFESEPEAMAVHGIGQDRICAAPPSAEVDDILTRWLDERGVQPGAAIAVGWSVTTFDLPFLGATLPRSYRHFHRHSVELNAVCYTFAPSVRVGDRLLSPAQWRDLASEQGRLRAQAAGVRGDWHDAGFDAAAALGAWAWLRGLLAGTRLPG